MANISNMIFKNSKIKGQKIKSTIEKWEKNLYKQFT